MHYPLPLHKQPALLDLGYSDGAFPATEEWARTLLSLPLFPELERAEIERVASRRQERRSSDRLSSRRPSPDPSSACAYVAACRNVVAGW